MNVALVVLFMVAIRAFVVQSFYVPSASMEPAVKAGDRIVVTKFTNPESLERGDIVVFDGTDTFATGDRTPHQDDGAIGTLLGSTATTLGIRLGEQDFLKRIVGLPGDRVSCCASDGRLVLNGYPVTEPYLMSGVAPSTSTFDVEVPPGRVFVLGDNRPVSADSRAHLGDAGGGMVPLDDIIGRAAFRYWPTGAVGGIPGSDALAGATGPGSR